MKRVDGPFLVQSLHALQNFVVREQVLPVTKVKHVQYFYCPLVTSLVCIENTPTALLPHFRAFKRGILLCCISRGSKDTSKSANEKSDLLRKVV